MSTRSILALQKGNKVRYCFVHWDGGNHGQTLKEMLDSEIEDLFQKMSPVEDGLYIGLDHLHPKAYWEAYVKANREDWAKRGLPQKDFDLTYLRPQPTAYDPPPPGKPSAGTSRSPRASTCGSTTWTPASSPCSPGMTGRPGTRSRPPAESASRRKSLIFRTGSTD